MKIETLTPQIAALYAVQKATRPRDFTLEGVVWGGAYCVDGYVCPVHNIVLHLRPLSSLTEAEARELYEIAKGEPWTYSTRKVESCLEYWWSASDEGAFPVQFFQIGTPSVWLHLLSLGFDLLGLIEAGLAKEITNP